MCALPSAAMTLEAADQGWDASMVDCRAPFLKLSGHSKGVFGCEWSSRFKFVVSGGADKNVCVFNPFSGNRQAVMTGHTATVTHVAVNDDDFQVISLGMVRCAAVVSLRASVHVY